MRINARHDQRIKVNDEQVDDVEEFLYLGALLDKERGGDQRHTTETKYSQTNFLQVAKNLGL